MAVLVFSIGEYKGERNKKERPFKNVCKWILIIDVLRKGMIMREVEVEDRQFSWS